MEIATIIDGDGHVLEDAAGISRFLERLDRSYDTHPVNDRADSREASSSDCVMASTSAAT
jgi:hypothetical protein